MLNIYDNFAEIGDGAEIGNFAEIGKCVKIGHFTEIGNFVSIGDGAEIGDCVKIGNHAEIKNTVRIGEYAKIKNSVRIGDYARIGDHAEIGDGVEIGDYAEIGDGAEIGDKFRCEGLEVIDFFTMANVDGTGRKVYVYVHTEGITIRAGCFRGTLDEFCMKAADEGKYVYSMTVSGAAEAFAAALHSQGKTGGWDK